MQSKAKTFRHKMEQSPIKKLLVALIVNIWECIQKFPDWVDNEMNNNNKHLLRSNTKGYGGKTP